MTTNDLYTASESSLAMEPTAPGSLRAPSRGLRRTMVETWHHRELLAILTWREVRSRYKSSTLGMLWSMLNPLFLLLVYWLLFTSIFPNALVDDFAVYMLLGLIAWNFFASSLSASSLSLIANAAIVTRVPFPRQLIPLAQVLNQGVNFVIGFILVIPFLAVAGRAPAVESIQVVPVLLLFVLFVTGLALMVASGTVFFRDIEHLLAVILFPLFFATPVLWDFTAQGLTGTTEKALYFGNPVTPFVDAFRTNFYEPSWIGMGTWVFMIVAAAVSLLLGAWLFSRLYDELATEL